MSSSATPADISEYSSIGATTFTTNRADNKTTRSDILFSCALDQNLANKISNQFIDQKYSLHSIKDNCFLYGLMKGTHCCFLAAKYIDSEKNEYYGKHADKYGSTIILFSTYVKEELSFMCINVNNAAEITG
jgi:hypothetical protein